MIFEIDDGCGTYADRSLVGFPAGREMYRACGCALSWAGAEMILPVFGQEAPTPRQDLETKYPHARDAGQS